MSNCKKTHGFIGTICLIISFISFILAFCYIWSIFIFPQGFVIALIKITITCFFFGISFILFKLACSAYIGLSEKEVRKFDHRIKRRQEGIDYLICPFFTIALSINCTCMLFLFLAFPALSALLFVTSLCGWLYTFSAGIAYILIATDIFDLIY